MEEDVTRYLPAMDRSFYQGIVYFMKNTSTTS